MDPRKENRIQLDITMQSSHCLACGRERLRARHRLQGTTLLQCEACGLVVRKPMLTSQERKGRYSNPNYFSKGGHQEVPLYGYNNYLQDRHLVMWLSNMRLDDIEVLLERGRMLDLGCATGVMLDVARLRGWEVHGVDLSHFAVDIARNYYNLEVFEGELREARFPNEHFDLITMDDVVEHVPDPRGLLEEAVRVLRPEGVLALSTPNANSLIAKLMGGQWFHYKQEEHLVFFTPVSAKLLLNKLGLTVLSIRRSPRVVDLRYLFARLGYYAPRLSRALLGASRHFSIARFGFFVYTGEMTILARKCVTTAL